MTTHELTSLVREALDATPENKESAARFLSSRTDIQRYVVGKNEQSADIIARMQIDGVVDDFEKTHTHWNGVPIVRSASIPANAIVVNCSTSISPVLVAENLLKAGKPTIPVCDLIHASHGSFAMPSFVRHQRDDFSSHADEWCQLFDLLVDGESRQTLCDVLRYRLTADPKYMMNYRVRLKEQYFEDFMDYRNEVFVDAGGFDGDTTEEFCKRYPDYKGVYLFEPSPANMQAAQARLTSFGNIAYLQVGLSDRDGVLHFNPDAGSASSVSELGSETIKVTTLDKSVDRPVSFIKMDLEGWEMKALAGCAHHISTDKPKMAISVYHNASDFRDVPRFIKTLNPDYQIHLRHYTQGWSETVMFFRQSGR